MESINDKTEEDILKLKDIKYRFVLYKLFEY